MQIVLEGDVIFALLRLSDFVLVTLNFYQISTALLLVELLREFNLGEGCIAIVLIGINFINTGG